MGLVAYIESSWCLIRTKHLMLTAASGHCYTMRRRRDRNFVPGGSQLLVLYLRQRDWTNTIGVGRQTTLRKPPDKRRYLGGFTIKLNQAKKLKATCYKD